MKPLSFYIPFLWLVGLIHYTSSAQTDYVRRINCGSSSSALYEGQVFEADVYLPGEVEFDGDSTYTSEYLALPQPFKSVRYTKNETMFYRFSVANGRYIVILYFAEPYYGLAPNTDSNFRNFNVSIEGEASISSLNVYKAAGGAHKIYPVEREIAVNDGELTLIFEMGHGSEPIINAIEVLGMDDTELLKTPKLLFVYDAAGNQVKRAPEENASHEVTEIEEEPVHYYGEDPEEDEESSKADIFGESIRIFPNPTQGHLTLQWADLPEARPIDIKISDIGNRMVPIDFERSYNTASFDLGHQPSGMYVITFSLSDGSTVVEKILKK